MAWAIRRGFLLIRWAAVMTALAAAPAAAADTLVWDANREPDLAGYVVDYGFSPGAYIASVDVGNVVSWVIGPFTPGYRYYFAVRAYNTSKMYSGRSNEVTWVAP